MPETSWNGTSVYIKNMWIKQLCNHKVWDFATAFRVQKLFGTFQKRAPGTYFGYLGDWISELIKQTFK